MVREQWAASSPSQGEDACFGREKSAEQWGSEDEEKPWGHRKPKGESISSPRVIARSLRSANNAEEGNPCRYILTIYLFTGKKFRGNCRFADRSKTAAKFTATEWWTPVSWAQIWSSFRRLRLQRTYRRPDSSAKILSGKCCSKKLISIFRKLRHWQGGGTLALCVWFRSDDTEQQLPLVWAQLQLAV